MKWDDGAKWIAEIPHQCEGATAGQLSGKNLRRRSRTSSRLLDSLRLAARFAVKNAIGLVCRKECDWPIIVQVQIAFVCLTHQEGVSALTIAARALVMHTVIFKNNHTISLRNEIQTGCSLVAPSPAAPECQQISTPQSYCQARSKLRPKRPVDRLR